MHTLKVIIYVKQTMFGIYNNNKYCEHSVFSNTRGTPRCFFVFYSRIYYHTIFSSWEHRMRSCQMELNGADTILSSWCCSFLQHVGLFSWISILQTFYSKYCKTSKMASPITCHKSTPCGQWNSVNVKSMPFWVPNVTWKE